MILSVRKHLTKDLARWPRKVCTRLKHTSVGDTCSGVLTGLSLLEAFRCESQLRWCPHMPELVGSVQV